MPFQDSHKTPGHLGQGAATLGPGESRSPLPGGLGAGGRAGAGFRGLTLVSGFGFLSTDGAAAGGWEACQAPVAQVLPHGARARWPPHGCPPSPQLIYDAGVPFVVIMFSWSGLACLIFLNCALNWPSESFPAPEEVDYV